MTSVEERRVESSIAGGVTLDKSVTALVRSHLEVAERLTQR